MYVRNLDGDEFHVMVTSTNDQDLNSNQVLTSEITSNKVNDLFIDKLTEMWDIVDHDDVQHKIIYSKKQGKGNRQVVNIKAIPLFMDKFNTLRIYETYNQHMTAAEFFTILFRDTGFNFVLVDSFYAIQWEGLGAGEARLKLFERGLNRYKAEFRLSGNTVYLESQIGRDTSFMYRHKLNASDIAAEADATELWTYARGYGDYAEGDEANAALMREYRSPLADIPGIGERHAPPIYDGRVTVPETMDESLKTIVDESLKISVTATIHDLRKQGYPLAQPELGDRTFLMDERINYDEEVRINHLSTTKDWRGNVKDLKATFGAQSITKRYQSKFDTAIDRFNELIEGRLPLPYNVLPEAIRRASEALLGAMTELEINESGIIARDPNNPNRLVLYNSAGLGISLDGGVTFEEAITYLGINTKLLTAGDIHTNNIRIIGQDSYFFWDGNGLQAIDPNDMGKYVKLTSAGLYIAKGAVTIEREDGYKVINNGYATFDFSVDTHEPTFTANSITIENNWWRTTYNTHFTLQFYTYKHSGRYLNVWVSHGLSSISGEHAGTSGGIYIYSTSGEILGQKTFYNQRDDEANNQSVITVDLGVPTGNMGSFYLRGNTGVTTNPAYFRKTRIWISG